MKSHKCKYCFKQFKNEMGTTQHIGKIHKSTVKKEKDEKRELYKFKCNICNLKIKTKHGLKTHNGMYHKRVMIYNNKCKLCDKTFKTYQGLTKHINKTHKIITEDYYKTFYLKENKNKCQCGNNKKFKNINEGYIQFCSQTCEYYVKHIMEKLEQTMLKKYGVKRYAQLESDKKRSRNLWKNQEVRDKRKKTNIEKYGHENPGNNEKVKEKWRISMENGGYEKYRLTCKERYDVDHFSKTDTFKKSFKSTCIKRFGVDHPMKNFEIKERAVTNSYKSLNSKPYSKLANKVFSELIDRSNIKSIHDIEIFYGKEELILKNEFNEIFKYDFVVKVNNNIKIIIDFHGIMFHPKNNSIPNNNPFKINIDEANQRDNKRKILAKKKSKIYCVIWEDEWKNDKVIVLNKMDSIFKSLEE